MLSKIMKEKGISTSRLSELTGISARTIAGYRCERREPSLTNGLIMAAALNIDPYELIETDGTQLCHVSSQSINDSIHINTVELGNGITASYDIEAIIFVTNGKEQQKIMVTCTFSNNNKQIKKIYGIQSSVIPKLYDDMYAKEYAANQLQNK